MNHHVFIGESGTKNNMTRRYGRARGGARCCDAVLASHVLSMTLIFALMGHQKVLFLKGLSPKDYLKYMSKNFGTISA